MERDIGFWIHRDLGLGEPTRGTDMKYWTMRHVGLQNTRSVSVSGKVWIDDLMFFFFFFLQVFQVKWNCYFGFGRKKQWNRRRKSKMTWTSCLSQSLDRKCQQVCYVQRAVNAGTHQVTGWGDLLSQWQYNEQWLKRLIFFFCYCFLWDHSVQSLVCPI